MPGTAETEGVVIIAPLEVQEAPSGTRTGPTSLQGALAILVVATQLVAFVQLPEAHGGSEPAPAARAGPAEATAVAAAPGRKMTSSGSSSSSSSSRSSSSNDSSNSSSNGSSSTRPRSSIRIKSSIRASISLSSMRKGYGSGVWIKGMDQGYGSCSTTGYGSRYGSGGMDRVWVQGLDPYLVF